MSELSRRWSLCPAPSLPRRSAGARRPLCPAGRTRAGPSPFPAPRRPPDTASVGLPERDRGRGSAPASIPFPGAAPAGGGRAGEAASSGVPPGGTNAGPALFPVSRRVISIRACLTRGQRPAAAKSHLCRLPAPAAPRSL